MKFVVRMPEVWIQDVLVEADSREEALEKCANGDGDYLGEFAELDHTTPHFEFSHTLEDIENWEVKKYED